ncbi:hypothetical protein ElyMa_004839400 [Elysia marginata]|uniref:Uncharacterized protein n=1 Tax=Elysia marginata TaxID=1093978 RepID=A0AAV4IPR7_9GAST|nr:hypothetical protein ElyMa_004839400 [Elysia marginata]
MEKHEKGSILEVMIELYLLDRVYSFPGTLEKLQSLYFTRGPLHSVSARKPFSVRTMILCDYATLNLSPFAASARVQPPEVVCGELNKADWLNFHGATSFRNVKIKSSPLGF